MEASKLWKSCGLTKSRYSKVCDFGSCEWSLYTTNKKIGGKRHQSPKAEVPWMIGVVEVRGFSL